MTYRIGNSLRMRESRQRSEVHDMCDATRCYRHAAAFALFNAPVMLSRIRMSCSLTPYLVAATQGACAGAQ